MKKLNYLLFASVFAAVLNPASAAELYNKDGNRVSLDGSLKVRHYFSKDDGYNGDQSKVKFTVKGETRVNDLITGYARWEYNIKGNQSENNAGKSSVTRIGYAGISFDKYGSFDYGRNYGVLNDINSWTGAPVPVFGGQSYDSTDNFMTYRTNNVATYRNRGFFELIDGLDIGIQVQGRNDGWNDTEHQTGPKTNNPRAVGHQNGTGIGTSTVYHFDNGISVGASYANSERTDEQQLDRLGKKAYGWNTGIKYDANNVYLAAMYADVRNMHYIGKTSGFAPKTQAFELLAQYQFDCGLQPSVNYQQGVAKNLHGAYGNKQDVTKYVDMAVTYDFNRNMSLVFDYKLNLLDVNSFTKANHISTDDIFVTMLNYRF